MLKSHFLVGSPNRVQVKSCERVKEYEKRAMYLFRPDLKEKLFVVICNVTADTAHVSISKAVVTNSAKDNAELTKRCLNSLSTALEPDASTLYWCYPWLAAHFYRASLTLALQADPGSRNLFSVNSGASAAICNMYPREHRAASVTESMAEQSGGPFKEDYFSGCESFLLNVKAWLSIRPNRWMEAYVVGAWPIPAPARDWDPT
jgi:hypothetical protein